MSSMSSGSTPGFAPLKFVSEAEIEEKRKKRQEEWEKVRQPHQPLGDSNFSSIQTLL